MEDIVPYDAQFMADCERNQDHALACIYCALGYRGQMEFKPAYEWTQKHTKWIPSAPYSMRVDDEDYIVFVYPGGEWNAHKGIAEDLYTFDPVNNYHHKELRHSAQPSLAQHLFEMPSGEWDAV